MGTWGTAILDNDLAEDLFDQWKELLAEGYEPEEISNSIIESAEEEGILKEPEGEYEFWISFALIQWKTGRLQPKIKEKALQLLIPEKISEIEKERWDNEKDLRKRLNHLSKLIEILNSEQPLSKKLPKVYKQTTILKKGDTITIQLQSGNYVILEIIDIELSHNNERPIAILYNYLSDIKPNMEILKDYKLIEFSLADIGFPKSKYTNFTLSSVNKKQKEPVERIIFLQRNGQSEIKPHMSRGLCWWTQIDSLLEKWILGKNDS